MALKTPEQCAVNIGIDAWRRFASGTADHDWPTGQPRTEKELAKAIAGVAGNEVKQ